jgi:hypothetical protein
LFAAYLIGFAEPSFILHIAVPVELSMVPAEEKHSVAVTPVMAFVAFILAASIVPHAPSMRTTNDAATVLVRIILISLFIDHSAIGKSFHAEQSRLSR